MLAVCSHAPLSVVRSNETAVICNPATFSCRTRFTDAFPLESAGIRQISANPTNSANKGGENACNKDSRCGSTNPLVPTVKAGKFSLSPVYREQPPRNARCGQ